MKSEHGSAKKPKSHAGSKMPKPKHGSGGAKKTKPC